MTPEQLIKHLNLEELPVEGGFFRRTYLASETVPKEGLPGRYPAAKPFGSAIYYLLTADEDSFSALHKLPTDEIYHFYLGDPVEMLLVDPGGGTRRVVLGQGIAAGQHLHAAVRAVDGIAVNPQPCSLLARRFAEPHALNTPFHAEFAAFTHDP